jgi:imidazolonepropionase-like amidohydrolase
MSNAEALIATTATAADVCGIADITGTLEPGKDADILVVAGNPLDDLAALHQVVAVFARGSGIREPGRASRLLKTTD